MYVISVAVVGTALSVGPAASSHLALMTLKQHRNFIQWSVGP